MLSDEIAYVIIGFIIFIFIILGTILITPITTVVAFIRNRVMDYYWDHVSNNLTALHNLKIGRLADMQHQQR